MPTLRWIRLAPLLTALCLAACDGGADPADSGTDAGAAPELGCGVGVALPALRFTAPSAGVTVGASRDVTLDLAADCARELTVVLEPSESGIIGVPATAVIADVDSRARVRVEGVAVGEVILRATIDHPSGDHVEAEIPVSVTDDTLPACDGSASATLSPGGRVAVETGSIAGAAISLADGAADPGEYHVDPFPLTIECGDEALPPRARALGPSVRFGPEPTVLSREVPITIPIRTSLLPSGAHRGHVDVAWVGPGATEPRIIPIASPRFEGLASGGTLTFEARRLGTYRAVVRDDAPVRRERTYSFRALVGFSMGGVGAGHLGLRNPELFDVIAPLGGPTDWTYLLQYLYDTGLGGFCRDDERTFMPGDPCDEGSSLARVREPQELHEHVQHFEDWYYVDEYGSAGQGGVFGRPQYLEIFRDLTDMFGNINTDRTTDPMAPNRTPPGVPDSRRDADPFELCASAPIVFEPFDGTGDFTSGTAGRGFFDDEYNPDGRHRVITFCDGGEHEEGGVRDAGRWSPLPEQNEPFHISLAVDIDGDGIRDPGEPVIRNMREPFDDFGLDGQRSVDEPGYDAVTNPDPAGDDYDYQYNPEGTEGNRQRDAVDEDPCRRRVAAPGDLGMAEAFLDSGIDGVIGTRQLDPANGLPGGGFDVGEGNGCFDMTRAATRTREWSPRWLIEHMDADVLADVDYLSDGGIRDLFNWGVMANLTMGGFTRRGLSSRMYNDHWGLHLDGRQGDFEFGPVPWDEVGRRINVRYGDPDATLEQRSEGNGGHAGSTDELVDRLFGALAFASSRWPDGDRRRFPDRICQTCPEPNSIVEDFTAPTTGRAGPVVVLLPPGYHAEQNADRRYPVVYLLHGYGMEPGLFVDLGLFFWNFMSTADLPAAQRFQKMIFVIPDGLCREDECTQGTFFAEAPPSNPSGARMETFLLDLIEHVDATYRTRTPEAFPVVE